MDLPMPEPVNGNQNLSQFEALTFDVYGTLIEYKSHILTSFRPLLSRLESSSPYLDSTPLSSIPGSASKGDIEFLKLFQKQEDAIKLEKPVKRFDVILVEIWRRIANLIGVESSEDEARAFGSEENIKSWPVFPSTVDALRILSKRYKLIALSNIDTFAWDLTCQSSKSPLGEIEWWKTFTAEDFGDDLKRADDLKLETAIAYCESRGILKTQILHVAQSLGHDHAPAKRLGLSSVFLVGDGPRWGKVAEIEMANERKLVGYGWKFPDLKHFAESLPS